jgi:GNAT superfamily N-acetyltransferase
MNRLRYELAEEVAEPLREQVYSALREFNLAANPVLWQKLEDPAHEARELCVLALDASGDAAGGLFAETRFSWLKISIMAVKEELRGQGIGGELLRQAESEAIRRGCRYAFVDTMSYQAPGFYERHGYQVAGRIEDWDSHGHAKIYLTKSLEF